MFFHIFGGQKRTFFRGRSRENTPPKRGPFPDPEICTFFTSDPSRGVKKHTFGVKKNGQTYGKRQIPLFSGPESKFSLFFCFFTPRTRFLCPGSCQKSSGTTSAVSVSAIKAYFPLYLGGQTPPGPGTGPNSVWFVFCWLRLLSFSCLW